MVDPMTVLAGAASAASVLQGVKTALDLIADRARESEDSELLRDVIEAQNRFIELQRTIMAQTEELQGLKGQVRKLQELGDLVFHDNC